MTKAMGSRALVMAATNDPVRTKIETPQGVVGFQEFFVRDRCQPDVRSVIYDGAGAAQPSRAVLQSIREAEVVIVAPSNPITSIGPMLAIHDLRDALRC